MAPPSDVVQVPPFSYDVATWFLHLEAIWAASGDLTDQHQYLAVVRALPAEVALRLASFLAKPPAQDRYPAVKAALVAAFGRTRETYYAELDAVRFEGGRPSALLARMAYLNEAAGQPLSEAMLQYRHTRLMPQPVQAQLAAALAASPAADYPRLVDAVVEAHAAAPVASLSAPPCACGSSGPQQGPAPDAYAVHAMRAPAGPRPGGAPAVTEQRPVTSTDARLSAIEASVRRLEAALSSAPAPSRPGYCYFHARFGDEARNCRPPCEWPQAGNGFRGGRR